MTATQLPPRRSGMHAQQQGHADPSSPRSPRWRRIVLAVSVVVLVPSVAFIVVALPRLQSYRHDDSARSAALAAARQATVDALSYSYLHIDDSLARMRADADPKYAAKLAQTATALRTAVQQTSAVATATVVASGLQSITTSKAVALVFVDQTTRSLSAPQPATRHYRLVMTLTRSGKRWLLTGFTSS